MAALFLGLVLAITSSDTASAQEAALLRDGAMARITRGGIWPPDTIDFRDTTVALYPGVRFVIVPLALEHGGTISLYEAIDEEGQLYLLDSPASFRLLHARHFRGVVDSATANTLAILSARFGGQLPGEFTLDSVSSWLLEATLGGGRRTPYAWTVTIHATLDAVPKSITYEVRVRDGNARLQTRECDVWCATTILEP